MTKRTGVWVVVAALAAGCAGADDPVESTPIAKTDKPKKCKEHKWKTKSHGDCVTVTATVGLQGGTVAAPGGPTLTIPFGALPDNTTITINETDAVATGVPGAVGPVFEFEPDGLVFAKPVTVTLPMPAGQTTGEVYWSRLDGSGFDAIGGTIGSGVITAQTVHFSLAVVGSPLGTQTLQGTSIDAWIFSSHAPHFEGTSLGTAPPSASCSELEAIVDDGAGGYARLCGSFAADRKTFSVPNVPLGGDYILHLRNADTDVHTLLVASTGLPDLGQQFGGRPYPTSTSTDPLLAARVAISGNAHQDLHIDGLDGWFGPGERSANDPGDQIEMFSTEVDAWWFNAEQIQPPTSGSASTDLPVDWENAYNLYAPPLIQGLAPHADRLIVAKLEGNTGNGFPYQSMTHVGVAPAFDLVDNGPVATTVNLAPIAQGVPFSVVFDGAAHYAALHADGNPLGEYGGGPTVGMGGGFVGVLAQGNDAKFGFYTANADLLLLFDNNPTGTLMNPGPMPLGTTAGLPGSWGEIAVARWGLFHRAVLPDTDGPSPGTDFRDTLEWVTTRDKMTGVVGPKLTQVTNARVNGTRFFDGAPSIGATTTITWDPPTTGTPLFYGIGVRELFVRPNNRTGGRAVASVSTPDRSFTFPPGILDPAKTYVFTIQAYASTGDATAAAALVGSPFKSGMDIASSNVSSSIFGSAHGTPAPPMALTVAGGFHFPTAIAIHGTSMYWTERYDSFWDNPWVDSGLGEIWTANMDGTGAHRIVGAQHAPSAIAANGQYVYWINNGDGTGTPNEGLYRMELSSAIVEQVLAESGLGALASNANGDIVYCGGSGVHVIPHDGSPARFLSGWSGPNLTADNTNAYVAVYGTGPGNSGIVVQVALDGLTPELHLAIDQPQTWDIETDGTTVYWTDQAWQQSFPASVNRVAIGDTTGTTNQTLYAGKEILKVFAIDGGYAYFVNDGYLKRVRLDGSSNGVAEIAADIPSACPQGGMTADNGHVVWTDVCSGEVYEYVAP